MLSNMSEFVRNIWKEYANISNILQETENRLNLLKSEAEDTKTTNQVVGWSSYGLALAGTACLLIPGVGTVAGAGMIAGAVGCTTSFVVCMVSADNLTKSIGKLNSRIGQVVAQRKKVSDAEKRVEQLWTELQNLSAEYKQKFDKDPFHQLDRKDIRRVETLINRLEDAAKSLEQ